MAGAEPGASRLHCLPETTTHRVQGSPVPSHCPPRAQTTPTEPRGSSSGVERGRSTAQNKGHRLGERQAGARAAQCHPAGRHRHTTDTATADTGSLGGATQGQASMPMVWGPVSLSHIKALCPHRCGRPNFTNK